MGKRKHFVVVPGEGDACPRCGQPTQIREHDAVGEKQLRQPFYYSRWFNCVNAKCRTTLIMPPRFIVWNEHTKAKERTEVAQQGQVVWGDSWSDMDTSGPTPPWE